MTPHTDRTLCDASAFGSSAWAAQRLGRSRRWLADNMDNLRKMGFPSKDPVVDLYNKADVDAWIARRTRSQNEMRIGAGSDKINFDAI